MEQFTYQQQIAIMRILLDIIHADGKIDARESFFFNKLKKEFNLRDSEHEIVNAKNSLLALAQVREMDPEQKDYFANLMSKMIVIDEDINVNEIAIYELVCEICSIEIKFQDTLDKSATFTKSECLE